MSNSAKRNFFLKNSTSGQEKVLLIDEDGEELDTLRKKLREMPYEQRVPEFARLLKQAKTDIDLRSRIQRLVANGMWLMELEDAKKLIDKPSPRGGKTISPATAAQLDAFTRMINRRR